MHPTTSKQGLPLPNLFFIDNGHINNLTHQSKNIMNKLTQLKFQDQNYSEDTYPCVRISHTYTRTLIYDHATDFFSAKFPLNSLSQVLTLCFRFIYPDAFQTSLSRYLTFSTSDTKPMTFPFKPGSSISNVSERWAVRSDFWSILDL